MHKSWGNSIEFDEAAERMGVDVMRWMFASARPEDNILFGWHAADEARRELLVLWNVYAFFVTLRAPRRLDARAGDRRGARGGRRRGRRSIAGSCRAPRASPRRSGASWPTTTRSAATRAIRTFIDDLSTWYLRRSRDRMRARRRRRRTGTAAFATLHAALVDAGPDAGARSCRSWPRTCTRTSSSSVVAGGPPGQRPSDPLAGAPRWRRSATSALEAAMASARRAVELARTLRSQAGIRDPAAAGAGLARDARTAAIDDRDGAARADRRRGQRQGRSS